MYNIKTEYIKYELLGDSEAATTTGGTRLVRTKSVRFSDGYVPGKTAESTDQQPSTSSSSGCCESRRNDVDSTGTL